MLHLEGKNYVMRSGDSGFADRQKNIFDQLDVVAKNHTTSLEQTPNPMDLEEGVSTRKSLKRKKSTDMKLFKGKESIFKVPDNPKPNRFKNKSAIPDYQKNPHKWTKYSLSDVSDDDMSERSNTAAAMAFLREIKSRKQEEPMESDQKIQFKKPLKKTDKQITASMVEGETTHYFRGSKLVMPEYVVGQGKKKSKSLDKKSSASGISKSVTLNHLTDEYDEDNDT